ncbi:LANO_0E06766g1_1 [Lachancea nothofagi CBS 11611]|uniref:LANO_0E06766g1_1 n=1 Tax=Lachancea nothofagi CBS 11611 TaxID=1266666 RepID=A0A1G4JU32_9SACH|nr:LANO_0E06766g1_1 [Lachancea nothofagi CBS 11611]
MASVASLGADWCLTVEYSKENLTQLLTELSAKGLHALTRPGHSSGLVYVFVSDQNNKLPLIVSHLKYVINVVQMATPETRQQRQKLAQRLVTGSLVPSGEDLVQVSQTTGSPEIGMYFAFLKYYTRWLMILAVVGLAFRFFDSQSSAWEFNFSYTILVALWAIAFVASWKDKFRSKYGAQLQYVPSLAQLKPTTRLVFVKKMCFMPIALQFAACLVSFQFVCFLLEIFITQIYQGPLSNILALIPTGLMAVYVPILTMFYDFVLDKLIAWEKPADPVQSKLEKKFVLTFLTSYMPLFITLFVYLPLGHHINAQLEVLARFCAQYHIPVLKSDFKVNTGRYQNQYFFFMVTGQIIALLVENVLPLALNKLLPKLKGLDKPSSAVKQAEMKVSKEYPEDVEIWRQACQSNSSAWGEFDVNTQTHKLIIQFGYVTMFSCIWPLAALCCVFFNLICMKLEIWRCLNKCVIKRLPNTESSGLSSQSLSQNKAISFWDVVLNIILWISTLVSPALVTMYRGPAGGGLTMVLEKRELWHLQSVVHLDWKLVLISAFVFEHLAVLCYLVMSELIVLGNQKGSERFVTAEKLQEPPHIDLSKVVQETANFMDSSKKDDEPSTVASKAQVSTKDSGPQTSVPSYTTKSSGFERPKEAAGPSQPRNTEESQSNVTIPVEKNETSGQLSQPSQASKSSGSLSSPVAGATVPDTIPTSKNYHLRFEQGNKPMNSDLEDRRSSNTSNVQSSLDSATQDERGGESSQKEVIPKVITTSPSDEAMAGEQFVPSQVADTSKEHVADIMNGGGSSHGNAHESRDTRELGPAEELGAEKDSDYQSEHSSPTVSMKHTQASHTPRKHESSSRKIIKEVLSPLGKLKKKFP